MSVSDTNRTIRWPGDPAVLTAEGVDFEALAHVLGNTCCWGGRTLRFYSPAQRAVTVCKAVQALGGTDDEERRSLALHALLADAWRAWLPGPGGLTRPRRRWKNTRASARRCSARCSRRPARAGNCPAVGIWRWN